MPDSPLNMAEWTLQHPFMKSLIFNALLMISAVGLAHHLISRLPELKAAPPAISSLSYRAVRLDDGQAPLRLAGAWEINVADRRFTGLSALRIDQGMFLAVGDRGAVARFDRPGAPRPRAWVADLREGPGPWGKKLARDAESLAADPKGRGFWIGYEQRHSLILYDGGFGRAMESIDLGGMRWAPNRGAEALTDADGELLLFGENGRDSLRIAPGRTSRSKLSVPGDVADAASAPDGSVWLLLRSKGLDGISQSIAPLRHANEGLVAGPAIPLPKGRFDNYEGMAIEQRPGGGWRFWLVTDDGHRLFARTLLVALDLDHVHAKSPAPGAGPSATP